MTSARVTLNRSPYAIVGRQHVEPMREEPLLSLYRRPWLARIFGAHKP